MTSSKILRFKNFFLAILAAFLCILIQGFWGAVAEIAIPDKNTAILTALILYLITTFIVSFIWYQKIRKRNLSQKIKEWQENPELRKKESVEPKDKLIYTRKNCYMMLLVVTGYTILSLFFSAIIQNLLSIQYEVKPYENTEMYICMAILMGPIVEEFVFRGIVLSYLQENYRFWTANIIQAFLFGLAHGNVTQGIYAGCFALILGYCCCKFQTLLIPIFMHQLFNYLGLVIPTVIQNDTIVLWLVIGLICFISGMIILSDELSEEYRFFVNKKKKRMPNIIITDAELQNIKVDAIFSITEEDVLNETEDVKTILDLAGPAIKKKRNKLHLNLGETGKTTAGNLQANYIIHGVIPEKKEKAIDGPQFLISKMIDNAFETAQNSGVKNLCIIGLEDTSYSVKQYVKYLIRGITDTDYNSFQNIYIFCRKEETANICKKYISKIKKRKCFCHIK